MSDNNSELNIIICQQCNGRGKIQNGICHDCEGIGFGAWHQGVFLYWQYPMSFLLLWQQKLERIVKKIIKIGLGVLAFVGVASLAFYLYAILTVPNFNIQYLFIWRYYQDLLLIFWVSLAGDMYLIYRHNRELEAIVRVKKKVYSEYDVSVAPPKNWQEIKKLKRHEKLNVAKVLTPEARLTVENAWFFSRKIKCVLAEPIHLLVASLNSKKTSIIFARLGIDGQVLGEKIKSALARLPSGPPEEIISTEFVKSLFVAYIHAYENNFPTIDVPSLLVGLASQKTYAFDVLFDLEIDDQKLENVVAWLQINEKLYKRSLKLKSAAKFKPKSGMDRAMTAVATPFLNRFSQDLTQMARGGYLEPCVARNDEIAEIFRIMQSGVQNVLMVGSMGVGTSSIINGIAQMMVEEDVPPILKDKRLVSLNVSSLIAGAGAVGEIEQRLQIIASEISRAGNIILFIDNIHNMVGVSSAAGGGALDISEQLAEFIAQRYFLAFAITTPQEYVSTIERSSLVSVFTSVRINEMSTNQAIRVIESKVGVIEYKNNVYFSYDAIAKAVDLSDHYIHDSYLPSKAIKIIEEVAVYVKNKKGAKAMVEAEDVAQIISHKVGIPATKITKSEQEKLLNLEDEIHHRVIGQNEAVQVVASALRRARAELRDMDRPIANFLFLGPTGVGKTELAKTVAEVYFGHEDNMIRIDMSEYQEKSSINRLIGVAGSGTGGYLTEAVRKKPFALVLLDELEKAHKDILNIFLQVMDDGRLTDATGRTIDFTNTIIIATSNAGTQYVQDALKEGIDLETIKRQLMNEHLRTYYRPEFLNRFDSIVLFKPLTLDEIEQITVLMLRKVQKRLEAKGIILQASEEAVRELASIGFDPVFGARPLRRTIQEKVDDALSKYLISGKISRRDVVVLDKGGQIRIEKAEKF